MGRKISVLGFESLKACKAAIRAEVDPHRDTGLQFHSDLVARLFAERHYALKRFVIKPIAFRWGVHPIYGTQDCFYICIEDDRFPNIWWREASWNKCILGWELTDETLNAELAEHFRRYALPTIWRYKDRRIARCEHPGCVESFGLQVHHVNPEFKAIATAACALLSTEERLELIRTHDWFAQPEDRWHPPAKCRRYIEDAHETAELQLLCFQHHVEAARAYRSPK